MVHASHKEEICEKEIDYFRVDSQGSNRGVYVSLRRERQFETCFKNI